MEGRAQREGLGWEVIVVSWLEVRKKNSGALEVDELICR